MTEDRVWFSRPSVESVFTPSLGIVHVCSTYDYSYWRVYG